MTKNGNTLQQFIRDNAWNFIITFALILFGWANLNSRVMAVEGDHTELATRLDKIDDAIQRIIVLEEHDKNLQEDISEIKADVKDLKKGLNIK